jgi:hypothetical protein
LCALVNCKEKTIVKVMKKLVLIGGHPKGFDIPFHPKTKSGKILRKITGDLKICPIFFDLWKDQKDEDLRIIKSSVKNILSQFSKINIY